jgi:nucleotide-binding universal stress UspA family protein
MIRPATRSPGSTDGSLMNELVVGFDGSDVSGWALRWAAGVAGAIPVGLTVLEAWEGGDPALAEQTSARVKQELTRTVTPMLDGLTASARVAFEAPRGAPVSAFLACLTPESGLVLGSRGRGGFAGLLLGSVSRECIEHAPCPVIIVRHARSAPVAGSTILVGHDGSASADAALEWAVALAEATGARVVAVHVWQTGSSEVRPRLQDRLTAKAARSIEAWAAGVGPDVETMEIEGEPRSALVGLAEREQAGLLVVGRRGSGGLRALRIGSVVSYLVTDSPIPIAVIPPAPEGEDGS